jgi:hypothetical protein
LPSDAALPDGASPSSGAGASPEPKADPDFKGDELLPEPIPPHSEAPAFAEPTEALSLADGPLAAVRDEAIAFSEQPFADLGAALADAVAAGDSASSEHSSLPGGGRFADGRDLLERGFGFGTSGSSTASASRCSSSDGPPPDGARFLTRDDITSSDARLLLPDAGSNGSAEQQPPLEASVDFSSSPAVPDDVFLSSGDLEEDVLVGYRPPRPSDTPEGDVLIAELDALSRVADLVTPCGRFADGADLITRSFGWSSGASSTQSSKGGAMSRSLTPDGARYVGRDDLADADVAVLYGLSGSDSSGIETRFVSLEPPERPALALAEPVVVERAAPELALLDSDAPIPTTGESEQVQAEVAPADEGGRPADLEVAGSHPEMVEVGAGSEKTGFCGDPDLTARANAGALEVPSTVNDVPLQAHADSDAIPLETPLAVNDQEVTGETAVPVDSGAGEPLEESAEVIPNIELIDDQSVRGRLFVEVEVHETTPTDISPIPGRVGVLFDDSASDPFSISGHPTADAAAAEHGPSALLPSDSVPSAAISDANPADSGLVEPVAAVDESKGLEGSSPECTNPPPGVGDAPENGTEDPS